LNRVEPSIQPSALISRSSSYGLSNYNKRIVIFTVGGGLLTIFMLIALFFHIKSKLIQKQKKEVGNTFLDIVRDETTSVSIINNETNI
jgi:hypothetical protein